MAMMGIIAVVHNLQPLLNSVNNYCTLEGGGGVGRLAVIEQHIVNLHLQMCN